MAIEINFPDKILAGVNQSYTITSDEGPPSGDVVLGGQQLPHRIVPLGAPKDATETTTTVMKYKVSFFLPGDSTGKQVKLAFRAGASSAEEVRDIINT